MTKEMSEWKKRIFTGYLMLFWQDHSSPLVMCSVRPLRKQVLNDYDKVKIYTVSVTYGLQKRLAILLIITALRLDNIY